MTRLNWNQTGDRLYESGVDRGVLYPRQVSGVPWNGLVSVNESFIGGETQPFYFDGLKYLDFVAAEDFQATIEAFSAPDEFAGCDGTKVLSPGLIATQQPRYPFGFSYRTLLGNDISGTDYGYKLHLVYNATATPAGINNVTQSDGSTVSTRSWTINTVPPSADTYKPTAHFVIDSTKVAVNKMLALENLLYGTPSSDPTLPTQATVIATLA